MKLEAGKTYVCRNGKIKTLRPYEFGGNTYLIGNPEDDPFDFSLYGNGIDGRDSEFIPGSKLPSPHDIVCEYLPE